MNSRDVVASSTAQWRHLKASAMEMRADPKIRRFAGWGAAGCLIGALVGEMLLAATRYTTVPGQARSVCVLIDCSGSMLLDFTATSMSGMYGGKMKEVKEAASEFVGRQNLARDTIAVVGFESEIHRASSASHDIAKLQRSIEALQAHGGTAMHDGLDAALAELATGVHTTRSILLFTDGMPDDPEAALRAAKNCREQKITIVAIATGDADVGYLQQITGDPSLVFSVSSGNFGDGFQKAEKAIFRGSLVESEEGSGSWWKSLLVISAWTALLACGTSLALIVGQNLYLKREPLNSREALTGSLGGIAAGTVAGIVGQLAFLAIGFSGNGTTLGIIAGALGRLLGWTLLGGLVGRGLSLFIPNLDPRRTLQAGAIGGTAGAIAFLIASLLGDMLGRFLGAAILGACIGMMIALIEAVERRYWLELRFGPKETIRVSLGPTPVKIGGDSRACAVYARGARPIEISYKLDDGRVVCTDYATERTTVVEAGNERIVGNLTAIVRSVEHSGVEFHGTSGLTDGIPPPLVAPPRSAPLPPPPMLKKPPTENGSAPPTAIPTKPNPSLPVPIAAALPALPLAPQPAAPPKPAAPLAPVSRPIGDVRTIRPVPPPPPPPAPPRGNA